MNWCEITISDDQTHFLSQGIKIFDKQFIKVLKFHSPGLAPVIDVTGSYHINADGNPVYNERFTRTFGYYCNLAAVAHQDDWFHLNVFGEKAYSGSFAWVGNYQEDLCTVRDRQNVYFHINKSGQRIYDETYTYCGDFKEGIACVRLSDQHYRHINSQGRFTHDGVFLDLGVFHKGYATAKDNRGWHHIDKGGNELYPQRYKEVEPFYNGFALVMRFDDQKLIIEETGMVVLNL